jgi:hypothetical protein
MRILDERGRLFGLINIIDLCALFIIILLIGIVGFKLLNNNIKTPGAASNEAIVSVRCSLVDEAAAKALQSQIGQQLVSGTNFIDGTVTSVTYKAAETVLATAAGKYVVANHPEKKDVFVTMKIHINSHSAVIKLGPQEIHIGDQFYVKTHTVQMLGNIEDIQFK